MVNKTRMEQQLVLHEGLRTHYYTDTEGYITDGVGFNVSARGADELERMIGRKLDEHGTLTEAEAMSVLGQDIDRIQAAVIVHFPEFESLNEVRQRVVLDMAFNLGFGALNFRNCIAAIKRKDWSTAARELHKSKWARQVGPGRSDRLAKMLLTGLDYTS